MKIQTYKIINKTLDHIKFKPNDLLFRFDNYTIFIDKINITSSCIESSFKELGSDISLFILLYIHNNILSANVDISNIHSNITCNIFINNLMLDLEINFYNDNNSLAIEFKKLNGDLYIFYCFYIQIISYLKDDIHCDIIFNNNINLDIITKYRDLLNPNISTTNTINNIKINQQYIYIILNNIIDNYTIIEIINIIDYNILVINNDIINILIDIFITSSSIDIIYPLSVLFLKISMINHGINLLATNNYFVIIICYILNYSLIILNDINILHYHNNTIHLSTFFTEKIVLNTILDIIKHIITYNPDHIYKKHICFLLNIYSIS